MNIMESVKKILPTLEEAGIIAVEISENIKPELKAQQQAFFIAGFQESIKYLKLTEELTNEECPNEIFIDTKPNTEIHILEAKDRTVIKLPYGNRFDIIDKCIIIYD